MHNIIIPGLDELMEMVKRSYYPGLFWQGIPLFSCLVSKTVGTIPCALGSGYF